MISQFKPKVQTPEPAAPPPTIDEAARSQDYADRVRRRKGRASTILVPDARAAALASSVLGAP